MRKSLQRQIATGILVCGLVVACRAADAIDEIVVRPLIDRPGRDTYCEAVGAAFDGASVSIDILLSTVEVEDDPLLDDLIEAHDRGVVVRMLLDSSDWAPEITDKNRRTADHLAARGIEVRFDDPAVTTHAKLVIVDRALVVVGSTNWNDYAFAEHEQANVWIESATVAAALGDVFDRLWDDRPAPQVADLDLDSAFAAGTAVVPLLDTDGTCLYASCLLGLIERARRTIHVVMYRLSIYPDYADSASNRIVQALIAALGRGVDVKVLLDDCSYYAESADANLMSAIYLHQRGIDVRFDLPERTTHAKLVIVDGASVLLGSTNWNYYSIERNVEANVALLQVPAVAETYEAFFDAVWREGRSIGSAD